MNFQIQSDSKEASVSAKQRSAAGSRSTWVSVCVNVMLSTLQIVVGTLAHSQALLADGIHSLSDLIADFVVLFANRQSSKAADEGHPYGHQRFETAASFVLGVLLLAVGAGMLWSALLKLQHADQILEVHPIALGVAVVALVAKESLFRYMLAVATKVKSSLLVANAWHARSDAASSLVVAAGIVGNLLGYPILDPVAALVVGIMIGRMGWEFAWEALSVLVDRAADTQEVDAIRQTLIETDGVLGAHDIKTRKMGDLIAVDVHLEVDASISVVQGHDIAVSARRRVMQRHRVLNVMTHVDPIVSDLSSK